MEPCPVARWAAGLRPTAVEAVNGVAHFPNAKWNSERHDGRRIARAEISSPVGRNGDGEGRPRITRRHETVRCRHVTGGAL